MNCFKSSLSPQLSLRCKSEYRKRLLAGCLSITTATTLGIWALAPSAIARPKSASNGSYVTREGGGSRGCGGGAPIMGLVPTEKIERISPVSQRVRKSQTTGGYTSGARPSFWFHVPFEAEGETALEFILQDSNDEDVYRTAIATPDQAGLIQVTLPDSVPELAMEERYRWFLRVEFDCPGSAFLEAPVQQSRGWIERYEPEPELMAQLEAASPEQQVQLYQDAGYWFDALNGLAALRLASPGSTVLGEDWNRLFELYKISEEAAQASFVDCCQAVMNESPIEEI